MPFLQEPLLYVELRGGTVILHAQPGLQVRPGGWGEESLARSGFCILEGGGITSYFPGHGGERVLLDSEGRRGLRVRPSGAAKGV